MHAHKKTQIMYQYPIFKLITYLFTRFPYMKELSELALLVITTVPKYMNQGIRKKEDFSSSMHTKNLTQEVKKKEYTFISFEMITIC